jgi:hypothetical protein
VPDGSVKPLPADVVLLHIGPHKTGTTALQGAFHTGRDRLSAQGVHYAGKKRQPWLAALAMTGRPGRKGDPAAKPKHWKALCTEVNGVTGKRIVVSSERFADATAAQAARIVEDLGGQRVHVLVTLRPLARIMASHWQQGVRNGAVRSYQRWLEWALAMSPQTSQASFWKRHGHDRLVERWASVVGPDRVTVLVADDTDRMMLLRSAEALLDLPDGTLVPEGAVVNRSLTWGEIEVVRRLNVEFRDRGWPDPVYARLVRNGVIVKMQERLPDADEPRITTPGWALHRAAEIGAAAAKEIASSGVTVIGDLSRLAEGADADADAVLPTPLVPSVAAANAITEVIDRGRTTRWDGLARTTTAVKKTVAKQTAAKKTAAKKAGARKPPAKGAGRMLRVGRTRARRVARRARTALRRLAGSSRQLP